MRDTEPTALELRDALRRGETTSTALTRLALDRIAARQDLGAFVSVEPELALAEAGEADRRLRSGDTGSTTTAAPLLGIPTAHKDLVELSGFVTTHGSRAVPHVTATEDDPVAAAVRAAGAVALGKTQVPEFGIAGYSENLVAAPAANPFDASLTAGGSSGGTAAAVAAHLVPAAVASDAGGSIRIPAAACGLIGLKPGRGVVPADRARGPLGPAGVPAMGVSGPIARTARDAALFFDALRGDREETTLAAVGRAGELRGLRIGVSFDSPFESWIAIEFSDDSRAAVAAAVGALERAGHRVEPATIDYGTDYAHDFTTVWTQALTRIDFAPGAEERLGDLARMFLERARRTSAERLDLAAEGLRTFATRTARAWGDYDAVLTPALASTPPRIGEFWRHGPEGDYRLQCEWAPQTSMVNVVGAPAVVAPTHRTAGGLPMGVQLIGRPGGEALLLQLAAQLTE